MEGNGRIALPNQFDVGVEYRESPAAAPSALQVAGPGFAKMFIAGGFTKLEQLAGDIAGQIANGAASDQRLDETDLQPIADFSVDLAAAVLTKCRELQNADSSDPPAPKLFGAE